ncbi:MAG: hypothetical protein JW839_14275 [Candidatus Lokiarchaeota archaeon]|nr:hypothetical protein [Candidatus Lokiarchaeota archaeon]
MQAQDWKDYADASPLALKFELSKALKNIEPIIILETKYRRTLNEQMGLVKLEHVIEIRHGNKSTEHPLSLGMVAAESPQLKRVKHLSSAEKIEATRKFFIDKANEERLGQLLGVPKQGIVELVTAINTGKFIIVKEAKPAPAKGAKSAPAKGAKPAPAKGVKPALAKGVKPALAKGAKPAPAKRAKPAPAKRAKPAPAKGAKPAQKK